MIVDPFDEKSDPGHCSHNYSYSHRERVWDMSTTGKYGGMAYRDVVVCTKCGNVRRP